ncbi:MAG: 50S ribosomal protein L25 [Nitrospirae bacterium]|nr:50S ribosomal protein L25 [Nitrospirota bacterium]
MDRVTLGIEKRETAGKGAARSIRRGGYIPAVIYRGGVSMPVQLSGKELSTFISKTAGEQIIVNLQFPDEMRQAIVKDYQVHPVNGDLLHVDFLEFSATDNIRIRVHVSIKGEAIGVKRDKGVLQYGVREIEVECTPDKITGHINVDVSGLEIGQSIHVRDLKMGEGIRVLTPMHEVIASVTAVKEEVVAPTETVEAAEPEVVKKGKKEESKE